MDINTTFIRVKTILFGLLSFATLVGTVFFIVFVTGGINQNDYNNTITVSANGEVYATPDIAEFSFIVLEEDKDVTVAQKAVTEKIDAVIKELNAIGIDKKDIQTSNYSSNPRYEWKRDDCVGVYGNNCNNQRVLVGYTVEHNIVVTVRNLDDSGKVMLALGSLDVENMYGPNFRIEDIDAYKAEARKEAIDKAKIKAKDLADHLGVSLGKIVSFSDSDYGYARSEMYMEKSIMADMAFEGIDYNQTPSLPVGEDKVTANVSITFKIR